MLQFTTILNDVIFILLHCLLFLFNLQTFKKQLFHPAVLFSLVWLTVILAHFVFKFTILNELYSIDTNTYSIFFIGTISFTMGSLAASFQTADNSHGNQKNYASYKYPVLQLNTRLRIFFLIFIIIGLPVYIYAAYRLFIASQLDDFFIGLRTELNYGDEDIGPSKYLLSLAIVLYAVNLYAYFNDKTKLNKALVYICLLVTIVYAIFATGRLFFFMIFAIYLGMSYLFNNTFSIKKYVWALVIFILFFMAHGVYYGKGGGREDNFKENIYSSTETFGVYLVSSLSALNEGMNLHNEGSQSGNITLRFFIKLGQQFHLFANQELTKFNKDFVFVPYATNVFTFYHPYIVDFGRIYAWFMLLVFGLLHTLIFNKAFQTKKFRYCFYYCMLLFPLLVSFFSDMYLTVLSTWIQIAFFGELIIICNKLFKQNISRGPNSK